jgi:biopolymer transport protein ExbD
MKKVRRSKQITDNIDTIYFADLAMVLIVVFFIMTAQESEYVINIIQGVNKEKCDNVCAHSSALRVIITDDGFITFNYPQRNISVYDEKEASDYIQKLLGELPTNTVWLFASDTVALKYTIAATALFKKNDINRIVWNAL